MAELRVWLLEQIRQNERTIDYAVGEIPIGAIWAITSFRAVLAEMDRLESRS